MTILGAHRFAQTDLAGALLHGREHDIHNTDTADDKRDRRHGRQKHFERVGNLRNSAQTLRHGAHAKIIVLGFVNFMPFAQNHFHLFHGASHVFGRVNFKTGKTDMIYA